MLGVEPQATRDLAAAALGLAEQVQAGLLDGTRSLEDLGALVGRLDTLTALVTGAPRALLGRLSAQLSKILSHRPDVEAILGDLEAIKSLRGGPADATAFHDLHVLQLAFKSVWVHAFDEKLKANAEQAYEEAVRLYDDAGLELPDIGTVEDMLALEEFIASARGAVRTVAPPMPPNVENWLGATISSVVWAQFSDAQRAIATQNGDAIQSWLDAGKPFFSPTIVQIYRSMEEMAKHPDGAGGKLSRLLDELGSAMSEPYAFDVFAPDSYNYGLLLTYRQQWTPLEYQAGDLRATIPLAPGEVRKYSKRTTIKKTRAEKMVERSVTASSLQTSER